MTTLHHIGELLQSGVRPTAEETEHLRSLGGFVAEMFGRYFAGGKEFVSSGPDAWSGKLAGRLSAANGARWEQGLGLGEMFLASDLTHFWQLAQGGFGEGYGNLESERSLLELFEEEQAEAPAVEESAPRKRRPSLFGPRGAQAGRATRGAPRRFSGLADRSGVDGGPNLEAAAQERGSRAARWADGGLAEMTVIKALESGGLFVGDQVTAVIAENGLVFDRESTGSRRSSGSVGAVRSVAGTQMAGVSGARAGSSQRATGGAVALDGLRIDDRTPALASALARANAVFGRGDAMVRPAVSASRLEGLGAIVPFSLEGIDKGFGLGERPVYGFYDSAETRFVNLPSESAGDEAQAESGAGEAGRRVAGARARSVLGPSATARRLAGREAARAERPFGTSLAGREAVRAERSVVASDGRVATPELSRQRGENAGSAASTRIGAGSYEAGSAAESQTAGGWLAGVGAVVGQGRRNPQLGHVALDSVVRPASAVGRASGLRPFSSVAGADGTVPVASSVVYNPAGVALPATQRGGAFAPRISVAELASSFGAGAVGVAPRSAAAGGFSDSGARARLAGAGSAAQPSSLPDDPRMAAQVLPTGEAPAGRPFPGDASQRRSWRLAGDLGPDLPIGAGFTTNEAFAIQVGLDQRDPRQTGFGFAPVVASRSTRDLSAASEIAQSRYLAEGPGQSRLAGLVDGLVWVSLPSEGSAQVGGADPLEGLGLSAVPTGRRAAMVPAGAAVGSIVGRTAHARGASVEGRAASVALGQSASGGPSLQVRGAGATGSEVALREGASVRAQESMTAARIGVPEFPGAAALGGAGVMLAGQALGTGGLFREALRSGVLSVERSQPRAGLTGRGPMATALQATIDGAPGAETTSQRPVGPTLASLASPFIGAGGARAGAFGASMAGAVESLIASSVERAVASGYGRLDTDRVLLAAGFEGVSAASPEGAESAATAGGQPQLRRGRVASIGRGLRGVEPAQAAREGVVPSVQTMSQARQALHRPVSTAREARAIAAAFSSQGVMGQALAGFDRVPFHGAASDEPMLGRLVAARLEGGLQSGTAAGRWEVSPELVVKMANLGDSARGELRRSLASAGWTESELRMLSLDVGSKAEGGADGSEAERTVIAGAMARGQVAGEVASGASVPGGARVGRSLARVMAGAESLGGPVEASAGRLGHIAASKLAPSPMPMLDSLGAGGDYFGSLASAGGARAGYASLRDELGELVKMAEGLAAVTNDEVAAEARLGLGARARGVLARASGADREANRRLVARIEALVSKGVGGAAATAQSAGVGSVPSTVVGGGGRTFGAEGRGIGSANAFERELARIEGSADATTMGFGRVGTSSRPMDIDEVEMSVLALEREAAPGLEARLAKALALSAAGPAGAARLFRGGAGDVRAKVTDKKAGEPTSAARADLQGISVESLRAGAESRPSSEGGGSGRRFVGTSEEVGSSQPLSLSRVIAPEVMLQGLRSPEVTAALRTLRSRPEGLGAHMTRVLATLADSGVDLAAARSSLAAVARELGATGAERFAAVPLAEGAAGLQGYRVSESTSELADGAPEQSFLQLFGDTFDGGGAAGSRSLAQVSALIRRGGFSRSQRAGMLSSLLRGTERAERTSLLEEAGGSDFAFAWLSRVDGTKAGLDIGLGETRQEFGRAFGGRRDSAVSMDSPMGQANLVSPAGPESAARVGGGMVGGAQAAGTAAGRGGAGTADRSGLRSLASQVTHTSTGAARPQHGASQAVRRTDWSFVDTGSRASTTHADLGRLAAAIVGSSESSQRAPMPLVVPAVKAVAQTALRDSKTSSSPSQPAQGSGGAPADAGKRGPTDAKMSEKAVEMLAIEMANRVARLMGLMKERIGVWS